MLYEKDYKVPIKIGNKYLRKKKVKNSSIIVFKVLIF